MRTTTQTTQIDDPAMTPDQMKDAFSGLLKDHGTEVHDDPRLDIVRRLIGHYDRYSDMIESIQRSLQYEIDRLRLNGLVYIHDSAKTSHWDDLPKIAAGINELRSILYRITKAADDPTATAMDRLIHQILPE